MPWCWWGLRSSTPSLPAGCPLRRQPSRSSWLSLAPGQSGIAYGLLLLLQVVVHLVGSVALLNGALMAAKGQTFQFGQLFVETKQLFNLLGLHVFAAIAILLGLLAFGLPGIYLSVAYWFSAFLLVDQRVSFLDALAGARAMVTPHWFDVAVLLLVIAAISVVGFLACGVGLFATGPLAVCIGAAGYLQLAANFKEGPKG